MSKAILVIDKPIDCLHCELRMCIHNHGEYYQHCGLDKNGYALESFFKEEDLKDGFISKHCPLRELPEKKKHTLYSIGAWDSGYNACIDEIVGGAK